MRGGAADRVQKYRVYIKYCVIFRFLKNIPDSGLPRFSLGVSVCTPDFTFEPSDGR